MGFLGVRRHHTDLIVVDNPARTPKGSAQIQTERSQRPRRSRNAGQRPVVTKVMPIGKSNLTSVFLADGTKEKIKETYEKVSKRIVDADHST